MAHELRDGQSVLAMLTVNYVESVRDDMARCALADEERIRNGTQSDWLDAQCIPKQHDDHGFPGRAEARRQSALMTPQQRRDYGMPGRGRR